MIGAYRTSAALVALGLAAACGLKGPLYLPDDGKEKVSAPASAGNSSKRPAPPRPAPQSQKKDRAANPSGQQNEPSAPLPDADRPADPPTPPGR